MDDLKAQARKLARECNVNSYAAIESALVAAEKRGDVRGRQSMTDAGWYDSYELHEMEAITFKRGAASVRAAMGPVVQQVEGNSALDYFHIGHAKIMRGDIDSAAWAALTGEVDDGE